MKCLLYLAVALWMIALFYRIKHAIQRWWYCRQLKKLIRAMYELMDTIDKIRNIR